MGICLSPFLPKVARAGLHHGEEPCISGSNGSGTIFFSGCSLKCVFCQNYLISHQQIGKEISIEKLSDIFKELEKQGANNINLVTPTHYITSIKKALEIYRPNIPIVYNCGGYEDLKVIEENLFDIYIFDLKFFSSEKSKKYANCENYFHVATKALKRAYDIIGRPVINNDGLMQKGIIVRHLILPQSTNDSIEIIKWLNHNTPNIYFSLMSQYIPLYKACDYPEINRKITRREYNKVINFCMDKDFDEIYIQSLKSATTDMIPNFDLTGI